MNFQRLFSAFSPTIIISTTARISCAISMAIHMPPMRFWCRVVVGSSFMARIVLENISASDAMKLSMGGYPNANRTPNTSRDEATHPPMVTVIAVRKYFARHSGCNTSPARKRRRVIPIWDMCSSSST